MVDILNYDLVQAASADTPIPNKSDKDIDGGPTKSSLNTIPATEIKTTAADEKLESISFKDLHLAKVQTAY